jgi:hypothetical protein
MHLYEEHILQVNVCILLILIVTEREANQTSVDVLLFSV